MDLKECKKKKLVKEVSVDVGLIKSLQTTSKNKFLSASMLKFGETTYSSIISLYYDSLRELMESLALSKNLKIYNHEAFTCFIKEILGDDDFSSGFDSARKLRNGLNYYGESLTLEDAEVVVEDIKLMIDKCKKLLK